MIARSERDVAIDQVNYEFIDVLKGWMDREKENLDGFINNPTEHVNWSEYIIPDFNALSIRSQQLAHVSQGLNAISFYKQGLGATRSQHDVALDQLPSVILDRLLQWMRVRYAEMLEVINKQNFAPIDEYQGLFTFDINKYQQNLEKYRLSIEALTIVYQYAKEQEGIS